MSKELESFINPMARYHGPVKPEEMVFNNNLQEFANLATLIAGLNTGNKMSGGQAFDKLKQAWEALERSRQNLL